jgi:hypothetical protein
MNSRYLQATLPLLFLSLSSVLLGQETSITGTVTDQSGATIPGARVRATPTGGGSGTTTVTNAQGTYQIPSLPAANYVVRIEAPGFAPAERTFELLVGQNAAIDAQLRPAAVSSTVDVISDVQAVDTSSSAVAGNMTPQQMHDIPLNGRNWMNLALMVPGITINDVSGNSPVGGADGGKFQINIDGQQTSQNNSASSFGQPRYSQDALAEFQIITNRFDATLGRASRAQVLAQTKSGTNHLHGTLYGYFRDNAMNAADPVANKVLPYSDQQFGGTVGGAVIKDKLWFFGAVEGERQPQTIFTTPALFNNLTFTLPSENKIWTYLVRFDYQLSDSSRLSFRATDYSFKNPFNLGGTTHPSNASSSSTKAASGLLTWTKIVSPQLSNELKLGFTFFNYANTPVVFSEGFSFTGDTVGGAYNYPSPKFENLWSGRDDLFWLRGKHSLKFGAEYMNEYHHGYFPQYVRGVVTTFAKGSQPTPAQMNAIFPVWNDPGTWNYAALGAISQTFTLGYGNFNYGLTRNIVGFWFQDDWKFTPKLTLNLGVRYDNDIGMLNPGFTLKSGLLLPNHGDNNNIAPRLGFVYDPKGDRKTVIRGGSGLYYADVEANQYYDQVLFNGETTLQPTVTGPVNLLNPIPGATLQTFASGQVAVPPQALQLVDPNVQTPYTLQASVGFERQLSPNWTISADYVFWRVYHEWIRLDQNLKYDPSTGFNVNPTSTALRPNPNYTTILRFATPAAAGAIYSGLQMSVKRRFAHNLTLSGGYTLARQKDSSGSAFYVANNSFNVSDEWSNGTGDQRHTLNLNGTYQLRWGFQFSGTFHFGSGADFSDTAGTSPFGNGASSNRAFLATTKVFDNPAWNYVDPTNPAYMLLKRNSFYGRPLERLDLRLSKTFTFKEHIRLVGIAEAFNALNHSNFGTYQTSITTATFALPAANTNLEYQPRMIQLAGRFEF